MKSFLRLVMLRAICLIAHANEVGVRIRFGLTDDSNTNWSGKAAVSPGRVASVAGWRFQESDAVEGPDSWKAATRPLTVRRSNAQKQKGAGKKKAGGGQGPMADNGVILRLVDVTEDSEVTLTTPKGVVRFKLADKIGRAHV